MLHTKRIITLMGLASALALMPAIGFAQAVQDPGQMVQSFANTTTGLQLKLKDGYLNIDPQTDTIIHVKFSNTADWAGNYNPAVIAKLAPIKWTSREDAESVYVQTASLDIEIDKASGGVRYKAKDGSQILYVPLDSNLSSSLKSQSFNLNSDESVYGLGQHQSGLLDYRGSTVLLEQINSDVGVPMLISSKGYGILWNNAAVTRVDVATPQNANSLKISSEAGEGIDYQLIFGPEVDDIIAGYRQLTGQAPMMARWTWGLWQSKERYQTQDETLSIVTKYRDMKVPYDAVVQDWQYWAPKGWGSHEFDKTRFPDPAAMVEAVHKQNAHIIISVWPRFDLTTANHDELKSAGALFERVYPNVYPAGEGRWYDAWSQKGRDIYWRQIMTKLGRYDFDGWWLDGAEAELGGQAGQMAEVTTAAGPGAEVFNAYPLLHTTAVHDGMRRDMPQKRAFILTRSAYAGQQRNAAITWSGDTVGNWDIFAKQIPAALNFSLSGIPYWSADIGGFFGGDPKDPKYAELFTRWYQFGVFNPMFRVHGTGAGKAVWDFEPETQKTLIAYDQLRYRLLPYIYSTAWEVTHRSGSMMRPLVMDFRNDRTALTIRDQYMFGHAFMVSPVTQAHADVRTVYLPKGDWYDFWTNSKIEGGRVIAAKADINTIPLHVPAGTVLPLGPIIQYADQKSAEPMEIRVYPGRDGHFELYDDAGDGYQYEKGQYATIDLTWNEAQKKLMISDRTGQFPGMSFDQAFKVVCVTSGEVAKVDYAGKAVAVDLKACH